MSQESFDSQSLAALLRSLNRGPYPNSILVPQSAFDNLLDRYGRLSPAQISQASTSQTYVRGLLANKSDTERDFPRLIPGDFLSGSYPRGTKIYPLDDIDVMMVIDGTGLIPYRNGALWNATVEGSGADYNPLLRQLNSAHLLSSQLVINHFKRALQQAYPSSKVAKDGQAVNVWLESYNLGLDIVPCFHIIPRDGSKDVYYIPAGTGKDGWIITNPKIDEQISDYLHKYHNEKLKPVIRLLKIWNRVANDDCLRSYHLETMAWRVFAARTDQITDYGEALKYFFDRAPQLILQSCPDATGLSGPVDAQLSHNDRMLSWANLENARKIFQTPLSQTPLALLSSNPAPSLTAWRKLYGDMFGN